MPIGASIRGPCPRFRERPAITVAGLILCVLFGGSCGGAGSDPTTPGELLHAFTSIRLTAPATLLVNERALLGVEARDLAGRDMDVAAKAVYSSSDSSVVSVSTSGVVRGRRRGSATITVRLDAITASAHLAVLGRVKILPQYLPDLTVWPMTIGDTLQLTAVYVDVNGVRIAESPEASWGSNLPDEASVDATGRVIALASGPRAMIKAQTPDGSDSAEVSVFDTEPGPPAIIRYAHAAKGVGPITFIPNKGDPVTVGYGESVDQPIRPGVFYLRTEVLLPGEAGTNWHPYEIVHGGERLSHYAVGSPQQARVVRMWSTPTSPPAVPADSGYVRLVQAWNPFPVVYLRPTGSPATGLPELCYFDPTDIAQYMRPAGPFDLILAGKYGTEGDTARLHADAPGGRVVTIVLTGSSDADMGILSFFEQ